MSLTNYKMSDYLWSIFVWDMEVDKPIYILHGGGDDRGNTGDYAVNVRVDVPSNLTKLDIGFVAVFCYHYSYHSTSSDHACGVYGFVLPETVNNLDYVYVTGASYDYARGTPTMIVQVYPPNKNKKSVWSTGFTSVAKSLVPSYCDAYQQDAPDPVLQFYASLKNNNRHPYKQNYPLKCKVSYTFGDSIYDEFCTSQPPSDSYSSLYGEIPASYASCVNMMSSITKPSFVLSNENLNIGPWESYPYLPNTDITVTIEDVSDQLISFPPLTLKISNRFILSKLEPCKVYLTVNLNYNDEGIPNSWNASLTSSQNESQKVGPYPSSCTDLDWETGENVILQEGKLSIFCPKGCCGEGYYAAAPVFYPFRYLGLTRISEAIIQ